jgi:hypothetical protein
MDTREAAERWRDVWARGWREHDADSILALYAPAATQQSHPFRDTVAPADYIVPTLEAEESAECRFGEPIVDGDRAAVEWSAETRLKDGGTEKLAGVSLLRFDAGGLVVEQRDFWASG